MPDTEIEPHNYEASGERQLSMFGQGWEFDPCKVCGQYKEHPHHEIPTPAIPDKPEFMV